MRTLSTLLSQRAQADGARVALSFKERGVWRRLDWTGVDLATSRLRSALSGAGFGEGAVLFVSKRASAHTLLAVLAAVSLGGSVSEVDERARTTASVPSWAFARNSGEPAGSVEAGAAGLLSGVLFDDQRGASPVFATERCVLEVSLAADSEAKQVLTRWLTQGFELGIPEGSESTERDAGELGVSLRIASALSWNAWADALRARFAAPGSRKRRFVDWALAVNAAPLSHSRWARWVSAWLVVAPLRRALRLGQWRRAVSLDAWPSPETALLLGGLSVQLEPWEGKGILAFDEPVEVSAPDTHSNSNVTEFARQSA